MVAAEILRRVGRYSLNANEASDAVPSAALPDAFPLDSYLLTCLQSGDAATSLSRFATVSAVLFSADLSAHPVLLSALRSAFPPCILSCVNRHCCVPHAAALPFFQPANSLSLSQQSVAASRLRSCLQFGDAATSLNRFASVSASLFSADLSAHPVLLSGLRSAFPPCILLCINHNHVALQLALMTPIQPATPLSFPLQSVSVSRSVPANSRHCASTGSTYHTRPLIGSCGATFVARQIPKKTSSLRVFRICPDTFGFI